MKKKKPKSNAKLRKDCVKIAKMIAKHRDNYTCVTCGRSAQQGWQIHGSHILPEGRFIRMSCVPINIMTQCARCHMEWHEHPLKAKEWFDRFFPGLYKKLGNMDNLLGKETCVNYKEKLEELKEEYNKLINLTPQ